MLQMAGGNLTKNSEPVENKTKADQPVQNITEFLTTMQISELKEMTPKGRLEFLGRFGLFLSQLE